MSIDSIGNFLTIMRNGLMKSRRWVVVPFSKEKQGIAVVLKDEGFIKDFQRIELEQGKPQLKIFFKYVNGESPIHEIKRISTPGRRKYEGLSNMTSVIGGLGISILTTSKGIISDKQAQKLSVGGEVICHIW
jgi:small subunit ribosomal protein S8